MKSNLRCLMSHTDKILKQTLAKMLPEYQRGKVNDEEKLLYLCHLVELSLDASDYILFRSLLVKICGFDVTTSASWQRRTIALSRTKRIGNQI